MMSEARSFLLVLGCSVALVACARTSVMPLSRNVVQISVNAAPVCGTAGAQQVAMRMAAAETINRGFERFVIGGAQQSSETVVSSGGPTTGSATIVGNTVYTQTYTPSPIVMHRRHQVINVLMLKPGDQGYENGIDAKSTLGADWQKKLETGSRTVCND